MTIVGYIVQYTNEDEYTVYHGFIRLHRTFQSAIEQAKDYYRGYLESLAYPENEIFQVKNPTKKQCDEQGSAVVFDSSGFLVWIDCVLE